MTASRCAGVARRDPRHRRITLPALTLTPRSPIDLNRAIHKLPADPAISKTRVWYRSQREHWLRWLEPYDSPGTYFRKVISGRDESFVHDHVVYPQGSS